MLVCVGHTEWDAQTTPVRLDSSEDLQRNLRCVAYPAMWQRPDFEGKEESRGSRFQIDPANGSKGADSVVSVLISSRGVLPGNQMITHPCTLGTPGEHARGLAARDSAAKGR